MARYGPLTDVRVCHKTMHQCSPGQGTRWWFVRTCRGSTDLDCTPLRLVLSLEYERRLVPAQNTPAARNSQEETDINESTVTLSSLGCSSRHQD